MEGSLVFVLILPLTVSRPMFATLSQDLTFYNSSDYRTLYVIV